MISEQEVMEQHLGEEEIRWGKVIDQSKCIGCHACTTACKSENLVPLGINRTFVKTVEVGLFPNTNRYFQIDRCNQCSDAPCVPVCPVEAIFVRKDGIVDFDPDLCIGCKACMAACPYDAINVNPETHSLEKCNFCAHRIDQGQEPACVVVCPEEAIIVGNLNDPNSKVSQLISRQKVEVRKPEKGTSPKVFYIGAHESTLNPTVSAYTGMHMWSEQNEGYPVEEAKSSVKSIPQAKVAYEVPHKAPWDWRVSLYTWTKSIAAGAFLIYAILLWSGLKLDDVWTIATAVSGGFFLGVTGIILIFDLEHPERFYRIFTRHHWSSWLVRGAFIIMGYSIVLLLLFIAGLFSLASWGYALLVPGVILSILTAIYTAFLFSKSKGRDLWQNPLLPLHFFVQAVLAGGALFLLLSLFLEMPAEGLLWIRGSLLVSLLLHVAIIASEAVIPHMTADASRAAHQMIWGRFRGYYWSGLIVGGLLPLLLLLVTTPFVGELAAMMSLIGLLAYEHAYVQGGQSVPLT